MNSALLALVGVLGAVLVAMGITIATSHSFSTYYPIGSSPAWGFGPRELAHVVGFSGCTLGGWALIRTFRTPAGRAANLMVALSGLSGSPMLLWGPDWLLTAMGSGLRYFLLTVAIPFYLLGTLMMRQYVKDCPALAQPVPATLMSAIGLFLWSVCWELGIQPFGNVYGGPPRGYIQWAQVLCDCIGILVPTVLVLVINRALGAHYALQRRITDLVS